MQSATFSCPTCGAAISSDSTQCQYCGSMLQTVACPSCFGMMFLGSKFCPHCGAKAQVAQPGPAVAHKCPRCQVALVRVAVGGSDIEECPHCGGLWVEAHLFEKICSDRAAQTAAIGLNLPPPVPAPDSVRYIKCPQCANLMGRLNYAHRSGVIIDVCRPHGVWIDRDGLRKIVEFIQAGGLDRERQIEKEDLDRQRANIQSARDLHIPYTDNSLGANNNVASTLDIVGSLISWFLR